MLKTNLPDSQRAFEYALYMIASSYFNKTVCKSTLLESNMYIKYKEQKLKIQFHMEEMCIKYMEKLIRKAPKDFFNQDMEVYFRKRKSDSLIEILFVNNDFIMTFLGLYEGDNSVIQYRVWAKDPDEKD